MLQYLFVPSPDYGRLASLSCCSSDYGRRASLSCCSSDYGRPASLACCHFLVKQYCITLVELVTLVELESTLLHWSCIYTYRACYCDCHCIM